MDDNHRLALFWLCITDLITVKLRYNRTFGDQSKRFIISKVRYVQIRLWAAHQKQYEIHGHIFLYRLRKMCMIIFITVALCNRADHYIFMLWFVLLLFFSSPNLSSRRLDVYHTSAHGVLLV